MSVAGNELPLEVSGLTKHYGDFVAVDQISFNVPIGSVVGLLGPNGAGKSTTIQMLTGVTIPTAGSIKFFGMNFDKYRKECLQRINYTSAYGSLQGYMTVWENLYVFAKLYSVSNAKQRTNEIIDDFGLGEIQKRLYYHLSAGQRSRVNLVKSLINDPELIMMDEPTASLDPDIRDRVLSTIEEMREKRNASILYTSHNMDEIARICDDVIFLDHGTIVQQDTPKNLVKQFQHVKLHLTFAGNRTSAEDVVRAQDFSFTQLGNETLVINLEDTDIPKLLARIDQLPDSQITHLDVEKPTLEDLFIDIARKK